MILSDGTIKDLVGRGVIGIDPFDENNVQPASVDLQLGSFLINNPDTVESDCTGIEYVNDLVQLDAEYTVWPGDFLLGATLENIRLPNNIVARLEGKSSLGRRGLIVHATAGYIDPGWRGNLTLEISNISRKPVILTPKMRIAQISFLQLDKDALRPYGHGDLNSRYQGGTQLPTQSIK